MQVGKIKEVCVCGFTMDSHRGILTFETMQATVEYMKKMGPPDYNPGAYRACCDNYRRDNLKYLEEVAKHAR